jgi:hypothetical protein
VGVGQVPGLTNVGGKKGEGWRRGWGTGRDREPIRDPLSVFRLHDSSDFDVSLARSKTSGEAVVGGLARLPGYRGRVGLLGRRVHELTARPTLGRIGPGVSTGASGQYGTPVPGRKAPCGSRLAEAPAPPRNRYCWGSTSLFRLASVVS